MKKIIISAAAAALMATSACAKEGGDSFYVKGAIGYGFGNSQKLLHDSNESLKAKGKGIAGAIGAGMAFSNGFRSELELYMDDGLKAKKSNNGAKVTLKAKKIATFANAYYDFKNSSSFVPYVMAGLGWAHTKPSATSKDGNDTITTKFKSKNTLAYQLGVGVGYKATKNVTLDLGYRYMDPRVKSSYTDPTTKDKFKYKSSGLHAIMAGVRVSF